MTQRSVTNYMRNVACCEIADSVGPTREDEHELRFD
jgi:hypothetical protein